MAKPSRWRKRSPHKEAVRNAEKRKKADKLRDKRIIDQGVVGRVVDTDFVTGDALVRFPGTSRDKRYHPDTVERMLIETS